MSKKNDCVRMVDSHITSPPKENFHTFVVVQLLLHCLDFEWGSEEGRALS